MINYATVVASSDTTTHSNILPTKLCQAAQTMLNRIQNYCFKNSWHKATFLLRYAFKEHQ